MTSLKFPPPLSGYGTEHHGERKYSSPIDCKRQNTVFPASIAVWSTCGETGVLYNRSCGADKRCACGAVVSTSARYAGDLCSSPSARRSFRLSRHYGILSSTINEATVFSLPGVLAIG